MKILAFSDIHDNLSCIRKLREQERNDYDAIVVAGDIGNNISSRFFRIVSTFECPVFYVYGNWDNELSYEPKQDSTNILLHLNIQEANGFFFTGYSGCPNNWGKNPVAVERYSEVTAKHCAVLERLEEARYKAKHINTKIDKQFDITVAILNRETSDRRKKDKLQLLVAERNQEEATAWREYKRIRTTRDFKKYLKDRLIADREIAKRNRQLLFAEIRKSGIDAGRLVLVAHERIHRIHEEVQGISCHLFGHRHGFKHTKYQNTHFVNVSALDAGTYCVIEMGGKNQVTVVEKKLNVSRRPFGCSQAFHQGPIKST